LSTTPLDASIIESFHGFTTANQIISNIKENSSYNGNSNLLYLQKAFVEKYKRLATSDKAPNGVSLPA
jgi:hypothetical protein